MQIFVCVWACLLMYVYVSQDSRSILSKNMTVPEPTGMRPLTSKMISGILFSLMQRVGSNRKWGSDRRCVSTGLSSHVLVVVLWIIPYHWVIKKLTFISAPCVCVCCFVLLLSLPQEEQVPDFFCPVRLFIFIVLSFESRHEISKSAWVHMWSQGLLLEARHSPLTTFYWHIPHVSGPLQWARGGRGCGTYLPKFDATPFPNLPSQNSKIKLMIPKSVWNMWCDRFVGSYKYDLVRIKHHLGASLILRINV